MDSRNQAAGRIELEALEPRLLLSADLLGLAITDVDDGATDPASAIMVPMPEQPVAGDVDPEEDLSLFTDVGDEALPAASTTDDGGLSASGDTEPAPEEELLQAVTRYSGFSGPVEDFAASVLPDERVWTWPTEMVTTLHAANGPPLTESALEAIVDQARANWAPYIDSAELSERLSAITVRVADLPAGILGEARGLDIFLDIDAAGHGWFIDPTPAGHSEFTLQEDGSYTGGPGMDLLTVVTHEMGHVLGLEDGHGSSGYTDLMTGVMGTGFRYLPNSGFVLDAGSEPMELAYAVADDVVSGFTTNMKAGLTAISNELQQLFDSSSSFQQVVPGVLEVQGEGEDVVDSSPTVLQVLDSPVDVSEGMNPDNYGSFYYPDAGSGTYQDRYNHLAQFESASLGDPWLFWPDEYKVEIALDAMDLNDDACVTWEEAFNILVIGQITSYLQNSPQFELDGEGDGLDVDDLALNMNTFLNGGAWPFIPAFDLPTYLSNSFTLSTSSSIAASGTDIKFALDLKFGFKHQDNLYLGYEAELLGVTTDPVLPGGTPDPTELEVDAGVHFKDLIIGFVDVGGSVTLSDFIFDAQDKPSDPNDGVVVSVEMDQSGSFDADGSPLKKTFTINIGFLGAKVTDGEIKLDMDQEGGTSDPSNPDALGFTLDQQGAPSSSGVITAAEVPEPGDFVLPNEVIFTLRVGTQSYSPVYEVTVPYPDANGDVPNDDIGDLVSDVDAALSGGIATLVSVGHTGGKLQLSLPNVTTFKLGFPNERSGTNSISGTSAASVIGQENPGVVRFLLSRDGGTPQIVSFTPGKEDHDGDAGTPDQVTIGTLNVSLNLALMAKFGGNVVASVDGAGKVTFTAPGMGHTLEITHTLTLDTIREITIQELNTGQLFDLDEVPGTFSIDFKVVALDGLEKPDDTAWKPEGTIKLTIDPWDTVALQKLVVDVNPVTGEDILRSLFSLTDKDGKKLSDPLSGSDMQPLLDFNVVTTPEVIGLINQLGNWFARLSASELLNEFDLLFADIALGQLLDYRDLILDTLLVDDGDDGVGEGDSGRLLVWKVINDQGQFLPSFLTAQKLAEDLATVLYNIDVDLSLGLYADLDAAKAYVDVTYDPINNRLTYRLRLDHEMIAQTVPMDFDMDLGDFGDWDSDEGAQLGVEVDGDLKLLATGTLEMTVGFIMGNAVSALDDLSDLTEFNFDTGITINDHLALTTDKLITPVYGRLSGDATFKLTVVRNTPSVSVDEITIYKADTDNNGSLDDLKGDFNTRLAGTGIVADIEGGYIVLKRSDSSIIYFQVESSSGDPAYLEFGLQPESASTVNLIAPARVNTALEVGGVTYNGLNPGSDGIDLYFKLTLYRPGGPDEFEIHLPAALTADNSSYYDLIEDLNYSIGQELEQAYGLNGARDVVVSQSQGYLVLSATHEDIEAIEVTPGGTVVSQKVALRATGLDIHEYERILEGVGMATSVDPASMVATVLYRGPTIPTDDPASGSTFGRLSKNADFTINSVSISIAKSETDRDNSSIDDLVEDLNGAINGTSLKGKIVAFNIGGYIELHSIDPTITTITLAGLDATEERELGLSDEGTDATAIVELALKANQPAPVTYGVTEDATFDLVVSDGTDSWTFPVTVDSDNTLNNRTIYDLAGSISSAIKKAYAEYNAESGSSLVNPFVVTVQAGGIVIGLRINDGTGTSLYNPYDGSKNSLAPEAAGIQSFSVMPTNDAAANELHLASAKNIVNQATTDDLLITTRDGDSHTVSLDSLRDPTAGSVPKLVGTLGDLKNVFQSETSGAVELAVADDGVSLVLIDKTLPGDTDFTDDPGVLRMSLFNGSPAALQLGLLGSDVSPLNSGTYIFNPDYGDPDGRIEGARVAAINPVDRFFIDDVSATATFTAKSVPVTADTDPRADIIVQANFGFVGVKLETVLNEQTILNMRAEIPFDPGMAILGELYDSLEDTSNLLNFVDYPTLTPNATSFSLAASIYPDLSFLNVGATPFLIFNILDTGHLQADPDPPTEDPDSVVEYVLPNISVSGFDIGDLASFTQIEFSSVLSALERIADYLDGFAALNFLNDDLPLLGVSIQDLLKIAEGFSQAVEDIKLNPAGGLQLLDQKIREAFSLPEFASNAELQAYFNNLGIPDPTDFMVFALESLGGDDFLRFDLRIPIGFSEARSIDLDLGEIWNSLGVVDIQGGAGLNLTGYLDARLSFGIDLTDPSKVFLFDDATRVSGSLSASASNIAFNAAIGPVGVFIKDGNISVDIDFQLDNGSTFDPTSTEKVEISSLADVTDLFDGDPGDFSASLTGTIEATLPVYFPTDSEFFGDIKLRIKDANKLVLDSSGNLKIPDLTDPNVLSYPDFSQIDLSSIDPFGSISLMLDSLDFFLIGLQNIMDGEIFGLKLPLIGDQLASVSGFIDTLRKDILTPIRQFVEQAPQMGQELIQKLLFSLLGPGSTDVTLSFTGGSLQSFLGLSNPIPGLDLLVDYDTGTPLGPTSDAVINEAIILFTNPAAGDYRWKFRLRDEFKPPVDFDFDLGWDALGLAMDVGLDVTMSWDLALGIGISRTDGAYLFIGDHGRTDTLFGLAQPATEELVLNLTVALEQDSAIEGRLAFLQFTAEEADADCLVSGCPADDPDLEKDVTYFSATFKVDLIEKGATDQADKDILTFSELGKLDATVWLSAEAEVDLCLELAFNDELIPDTITSLLPSIKARFVLDWETGNIFADSFSLENSLNLIAFKCVTFDLGSFLNDFLGPVVEKIQEITKPLQPIIDIVTFPIPVISQLAGQPITLVDIAGMTGYVEPAMIYAIADIIELVNKIGTGGDGLTVTMGDFALVDTDNGVGTSLLGNLTSPTFDLSQDSGGFNLNDALTASGLDQFINNIDAFTDLFKDITGNDVADLTNELISDSKAGSSGFAFPIYDNPASIFGLLLGRDIDLVTYDLAPFGMDFSYTQKFPIWDGLFARITGAVGLTIDLAFGYDTRGVREFADGGFSNPLDLLAGFFVSDTNLGPADVPELVLRGELFAGAELNLGIASAGAEGGLVLTTNFDLFDPDRDGKVRIDELVGNFLYEFKYGDPYKAPIAIFDVFGDVSAVLRLFVESAFFKFTFNITPPITLFEFSIDFEREPFLATERGDGTVLLNIGPNAAQRLNGDTRDLDERIYVKSVDSGTIKVWAPDLGVQESNAQEYELGDKKIIVAYGGEGNDTIDLSGVTHSGIAYLVEGGVGNDAIKGTAAGGTMDGGIGNDTLTGGDGRDIIIGGEGSDTIDGGKGNDYLFGDEGLLTLREPDPNNPTDDDPLDDVPVRIRSIVGEKDGADTIYGGENNDIIFGTGNIDTIEGNGGDDLIFGDGGYFDFTGTGGIPKKGAYLDLDAMTFRGLGARDLILGNDGKDTILAGNGDDYADGGAGLDVILGGLGFDTLYGGSGNDYIYGNENDDILFGKRDPYAPAEFAGDTTDHAADGVDYVEGGDGNDYIRGQDGNDILHGNRGADIIFGGADDDTIGAGILSKPWITTTTNPTYDNESGGDIIFGGSDDDTIDSGEGGDIVFGDDGLVVYINFEDVSGLLTENKLGSRIRTDSTGKHKLIGDGRDTLIGSFTHDSDSLSADLYVTVTLSSDGSDTIVGGNGKDVVFGGGSEAGKAVQKDTIFGDFDPAVALQGPRPTGQDLIIGDGGRVELNGRRYEKAMAKSGDHDGVDVISGNDDGDYLFGGGGEDLIHGFEDAASFSNQPLAGLGENDIILGDNGEIHYDSGEVANRIERIFTTYVTGDSGKSDVIHGNEGNDVILGGLNSSYDILNGNLGDDVILGDQGELEFADDGDLDTLDWIKSHDNNIGGSDIISGDQGNDVLMGGTAGDIMYGDDATASHGSNDGEDIMLGDNGDLYLIGLTGRLLVQVAAMPVGTAVDLITTKDTVETTGGADTMSGNAKADIMLGGVNNSGEDYLFGDRGDRNDTNNTAGDDQDPTSTTIANDADDILLGDNGLLDFTYLTDTDRNTLDLIHSEEDALGGTDYISGDKGLDVAVGGTGDDFIYGDNRYASAADADEADLLLGDNADIFLVAVNGASGGDLKVVLDAAVKTIITTDNDYPTPDSGGVDTISGNAKADIIAGGVEGDYLYGDREVPTSTTTADDGDDIILGDNGSFEWLSDGRLDEIYGIDVEANNADLYNWFTDGVGDPVTDTDLTTLDLVTTEQPTNGGRDWIYGDEGSDLVFGGTDLDTIYGDDADEVDAFAVDTANNDVLFGDHGRLYPQFPRWYDSPDDASLVVADLQSRNFFAIDTRDTDGGEGDVMHGEEGDDIMLGQQGDDRMWGGSDDDDMIGGHNVEGDQAIGGGYDELDTPAVTGMLNPSDGNLPMNDLMDGGTGNDSMAGDNTIIWRRGDDVSPRFRELTGDVIYTTTPDTITTNITGDKQSDPDDATGRDVQLLDHNDFVEATPNGRYGADVMAGGPDADTMYGQLGDDLMQGDGAIESTRNTDSDEEGDPFVSHELEVDDTGSNPDTDETLYFNIPEAASDGDDYMEGNGGNDLMYGGLGQDDLIGGSSALFGLDEANALILGIEEEEMRPDGSDIILGGAGVDIDRNDIGDATWFDDLATPYNEQVIRTDPTGHARDADFIMGDNANVYRIVVVLTDQYDSFNYDESFDTGENSEDRGVIRIIPRAMELLDYTLGGADYTQGTYSPVGVANEDNGLADLIHGEAGDDYIFGMTGSDAIYGEGQDDDIIGGYGNDWIAGGTGQDGVIGDDGLVLTSRNSIEGEPLYGITGLLDKDGSPRYSNGDALDELIYTPGSIQIAIINPTGALKKTVDLVPFSYDPAWLAMDDEFYDDDTNTPYADDIIFGGLGSDFLHGVSGDDAISGAEALPDAYVPTFDGDDNLTGVLNLGYNAFQLPDPINPGDVASLAVLETGDWLAFNPVDLDGRHLNNRFRAGEFFLYDEYDPRRKILLSDSGELWKPGDPVTGKEFLLNFDETAASLGVTRPAGEVPKATGQQTETYPQVYDDGKDAIFGDNGNDWLVGGTGRDNIYGGWGNDLLNADDKHDINDDGSKQNTVSDTHPTYEDRAYGGAGRDVLIGNTGGDRLIDWVGEYNSYLVPYAPFGQASVSRTLQPFLPEFLYALSSGDGADPTRYVDAIGTNVPEPTKNSPNPSRNGEPHGELGLVLQKDFAWQAQTGAPADPQAGNIPGGHRDVLRSAGFNDGTSSGFFANSGNWAVEGGSYMVEPLLKGGDALSVFLVDEYIPDYFEMLAMLNPEKATGGYKSNAYIVFDYQSETDFKFAGINVSTNKLEIGHRTEEGWMVDVQGVYPGSLKSDTNYHVFLALNGSTVTVVVDNKVSLTHVFAPRIDADGVAHGLNEGMVGLGANNSIASIDNVIVQRLAPEVTYTHTDTFDTSASGLYADPSSGAWIVAGGAYSGTADADPAVNLMALDVAPAALVRLGSTLTSFGTGGFLFDQYGPEDFKFVTLSPDTGEVTIGHRTAKGWFTDAVFRSPLVGSGEHDLQVTLKGSTVSVVLDGMLILGHAFNAIVADGGYGLLSVEGKTSFDAVTFQTDDPAYSSEVTPEPVPNPDEPVPISLIPIQHEAGSGTVDAEPAPEDEPVVIDFFVESVSLLARPHPVPSVHASILPDPLDPEDPEDSLTLRYLY